MDVRVGDYKRITLVQRRKLRAYDKFAIDFCSLSQQTSQLLQDSLPPSTNRINYHQFAKVWPTTGGMLMIQSVGETVPPCKD